jgi:crossover junction endodeoxyribonuclease RuvC
MKILGIDPGSHVMGFGIIDVIGSKFSYLEAGVIKASGESLVARLLSIADLLDALLQRVRPDAVAVEMIFHAHNSQSALTLGHARGVILLSIARFGAPLFEYSALQIKQAVTGRGRADKMQVQNMIRLLLQVTCPLALDASDALAAAVCHAGMHATPQAAFLARKTS